MKEWVLIVYYLFAGKYEPHVHMYFPTEAACEFEAGVLEGFNRGAPDKLIVCEPVTSL